jgi:hypothetical protein
MAKLIAKVNFIRIGGIVAGLLKKEELSSTTDSYDVLEKLYKLNIEDYNKKNESQVKEEDACEWLEFNKYCNFGTYCSFDNLDGARYCHKAIAAISIFFDNVLKHIEDDKIYATMAKEICHLLLKINKYYGSKQIEEYGMWQDSVDLDEFLKIA